MAISVALDAGHYTKTAGKRSPDESYFEYEFNWDLALKIQAHLERCGIKVYRTRKYADSSDDLAARVKVANSNNVNFFFSIHTNAAGNGGWYSARGYSTHVYYNSNNASKAASTIMSTVFPDMKTKYGLKQRDPVVQNLYVTRETKMPAVLVEHAFHTSEDDVALLKTQAFRRDMAELEAKGICKYLGVNWVDSKVVSSAYNYKCIGYCMKTDVVVRKLTSISSENIGVLFNKCRVEVVDKIDNWYKILYGETYGYVPTDDVTLENYTFNTSTSSKMTGKVNAKEGLNIRSGPSTSYGILTAIAFETPVTILEEYSNGWYKVITNSITGYCNGKYITVTETSKPDDDKSETTGPITSDEAEPDDNNTTIIGPDTDSKEDKPTSISISELKKMGYTTIIID